MPHMLQFGEGDDAVLFEVPPPQGVTAVGRQQEVLETVDRTLPQLLHSVGRMATDFETAVRAAPVETAVLEFGLQLSAKGRLYVVEAEVQGAIKVTLTVRPHRG